jgi:predicted secreted protein
LSVRVTSGVEHVPAFRESAELLRSALAARGLSLTALDVGPDGDDA